MHREEVNGKLMKFTDSLTKDGPDARGGRPVSKIVVPCREADRAIVQQDTFQLRSLGSKERKQQGGPL